MYRFLASTRWVGWLLLVVIFAAACVGLGKWQMDRRTEVLAEIAKVNTNYFAEPLTGDAVYGKFESLPEDDTWLTVQLTGRYLSEDTVLVRNRVKAGRPGYEVLVPFRTTEGKTVVIDRGYLPIGNQRAGEPDDIPAPPSGTVTVKAHLKPGEAKLQRGAPAGQIASIHLPDLAAALNYPIAQGAYGISYEESPAPASAPQPLDRPDTDEGPHLSYSYQWFMFGALAFVGFWYAARQQKRLNAQEAAELAEAQAQGFDAPIHRVRKVQAKQVRRLRRDGTLTDEAYEDAMLDEHEPR
ncbi:SURF1 family protein [Glutamicibacter endophyticus]|uniref:SURF1 family cytochrome oxidase biogenesis protein n=1 Tax=Glutamicibacter endophyticus TaxID=1522174 RepID=UPI003AF05921